MSCVINSFNMVTLDYDPEIGGDWTSADDYCCAKGIKKYDDGDDESPYTGGYWPWGDFKICLPMKKNGFSDGADNGCGSGLGSGSGWNLTLKFIDDPDSVHGPTRPIPWDNICLNKMEDLRCEQCGKNFAQCICNEL